MTTGNTKSGATKTTGGLKCKNPLLEAAKASDWTTPAPSDDAESFTNSIGMEFLRIPAGTFQMGSADDDEHAKKDEKPRHEVTISRTFHLGKYPVTRAQWEALMGKNPCEFVNPSDSKGPDHPAIHVSWDHAQEFIAKLNALEGHERYRLPTEAEWEYACRAGSETKYSFGDDAGELGDYAWYRDNSKGETHPVGQKRPNAWGLHDMHGNVWEWVQDRYGKYRARAAVDPQGPDAGDAGGNRVLRGGYYYGDAGDCRSASRYRHWWDYSGVSGGFRLALDPEE